MKYHLYIKITRKSMLYIINLSIKSTLSPIRAIKYKRTRQCPKHQFITNIEEKNNLQRQLYQRK